MWGVCEAQVPHQRGNTWTRAEPPSNSSPIVAAKQRNAIQPEIRRDFQVVRGGVGGGLWYTGPEKLDRVGPEGLEDGWKCRKKSCLLLRIKLVLQISTCCSTRTKCPRSKNIFWSMSPDKRCSGSHLLDRLFLVPFISKSQTSTNITEDAQGPHLK